MAGIIIKPKRTYPVFAGELPSRAGGRRSVVLASIDQDGRWTTETEDIGAEQDTNQPILFIPFGGIDYALNKADVKEMLEGMRERHRKWREKQPPPPDWMKLLRGYVELVKHYRNGRQQFYMKAGVPNGK